MADANVAVDETDRMIASDRVEGTPVYGRDGERLGSVKSIMMDKRSGKAEYAVMSFGGFLGIGEEFHPLPWDQLTYDTRLGGYSVNLDRSKLEGAPRYRAGDEPAFDNAFGRQVSGYYGTMYPY